MSKGHEAGHGGHAAPKPAAAPKKDFKDLLKPAESRTRVVNPDTERPKILKDRVWIMRVAIVALLAGTGFMVAKFREPEISQDDQVSEAEREENERVNQQIIKIGGEVNADNGNAIPPRLKEQSKKGKIVTLVWPGKRTNWTVEKDGDSAVLKKAVQKKKSKKKSKDGLDEAQPEERQLFRLPVRCVERAEEFRRCVNKTLHIDPRIISGFQTNAIAALRAKQIKSEDIEDKDIGGPLTTGQCAFELSALDATTGKLPYKTGEDGTGQLLTEIKADTGPDREVAKGLIIDARRGQIGVHDLAMECGIQNGFVGGHCGEKGNPHLYISTDELPKDDPRLKCDRKSDLWSGNRSHLDDNPVSKKHDDIEDQLKEMSRHLKIEWAKEQWEKAKEAGGKAWEKTKEVGGKTLERGKKLWDDLFNKKKHNKE